MNQRRAFAVCLALLAATLAVAAPPLDVPRAGDRALRLLSYNIHHGTGNDTCTPPPVTVPPQPECALDLARIAEVIEAQEADIVALQEVDRFWARSGTVDQPEYLSRALGMHACYGANLDHPADRHSDVPHQYGTLILSQHPILECTNTHLPLVTPTREQRGLLQALVNVRGVPLWVDNTHLDASVAAERAAEVGRIVELLGAQAGPIVLLGDLNARPTWAEIQPLFTSAHLQDAWAVAGSGPGFTYPALPTRGPDRRIDYVLASRDVAIRAAAVAIEPLTALAADHYPLAVDVALPGSEVGIGRDR